MARQQPPHRIALRHHEIRHQARQSGLDIVAHARLQLLLQPLAPFSKEFLMRRQIVKRQLRRSDLAKRNTHRQLHDLEIVHGNVCRRVERAAHLVVDQHEIERSAARRIALPAQQALEKTRADRQCAIRARMRRGKLRGRQVMGAVMRVERRFAVRRFLRHG